MNFSWPDASHPPELNNDVHVWIWSTEASDNDNAETNAILSPDESERMNRFRFAQDRRRYLTCHANLRFILSAYTGLPQESISFLFSSFGKPSLQTHPDLYFNLSHSHHVGLLAVTRVAEIGADVECIRPIELEVAEAHFSPRELSDLKSLDEQHWLTGFFNCWTRKEAILKAEGCGLNLPLDSFDVSLLPAQTAALRAVQAPAKIRHWKLEHLEPAPEVIGAVAIGAAFSQIRCFRLDRCYRAF